MKTKLFTFFLALVASVGTAFSAITVRLEPESCSDWSIVRLWAWTSDGNLFEEWPGIEVDKDYEGWYSYTFDMDITSVNIIWTDGDNQTVNIEDITENTCYALASTSGKMISAPKVDCITGERIEKSSIQHIPIGNLYYNLNGTNNTAEVTFKQQDEYNYKGLTIVSIPSTVVYDGEVYSVTCIGSGAFAACSTLTSITIPNSITIIDFAAFWKCTGLTNIEIPNSVTTLYREVFYNCSNLTSVTIGSSLTSLSSDAFENCDGITSVIWNAKNGPSYNFGNQVESYILGDSVEVIPALLCSGMEKLTSITIPAKVTSIGEEAFRNCSGLTNITNEASTPPTCSDISVFDNVDKSISLYVPRMSIEIYKTADVWKDFTNIKAIGSTYYYVTFVDWDGTILKTEQVEQGQSATAPDNPSREGYTFIGWDKEFSNVTSDLTVTAQYSINTHTVTFLDWDGTVLKTEQVEHGKSAIEPDEPYREGYIFIGWDTRFSNVQSDLTVTALYTVDTYTVTFLDWDATELKTEQVEYGKSATAPAEPTREGYTFIGWDTDFSKVTSDLTVTAQYQQNAETPTYYTVTFEDWDGTELKTEQVEEGFAATAPANPSREGYTFTGWDKDFSNVQSDLVVTALYKQNDSAITCAEARDAALGGSTEEVTVIGYVTEYVYLWSSSFKSVSFWMADTKDGGKVFEAYRAKCETAAEAPNVGDKVKIVGKLSVYNKSTPEISNGTFEILERTSEKTYYTIRFINWDGTELQSSPVEFATTPEYTGATPLRADDEYYTYEFSDWTPTISPAIKNYTYKATYKGTPKEVHGQAEETQTTEVKATPTEDGSVIIAWPEVEGATTYTIEISKNGELICTLVFNENGQLLAIRFAAPARNGDARDVVAATQTGKGWTYTISGMEAGATYTYSVTAKDDSQATLFEQSVDFTMPATEGIEDVSAKFGGSQKLLRNGQLLILCGEKVYTLTGQELR